MTEKPEQYGAVAKANGGDTAVAPQGTIKTWLQHPQFKNEVAKSLPRHLTAERFVRVATTALNRDPKLLLCTQSSFFECLMNLSQLGLEPDGRHAHLIPFRKKGRMTCQLIIDYKGLVELAMRSNKIANIHADVVCEGDDFAYDRGEVTKHRVDFRKPRGEIYAAYAICSFKDGTKKAEAMSRHEIEAIRRRSKAGDDGPWITDWSEMAKKTVFRRLSKWLPLSPEFRDVLDVDADVIDIHQDGGKSDDFAEDIQANGMDALAEQLAKERAAIEEADAADAADDKADAADEPDAPIDTEAESAEDEAAACAELRREITRALMASPVSEEAWEEMVARVGSLDGDLQSLGGGQLKMLLTLVQEYEAPEEKPAAKAKAKSKAAAKSKGA